MSYNENTIATRIVSLVLPAIFFVLLGMPLILKAVHVDNFVYSFTGTQFHGAIQVLANDAIIYSFMLVLFYVSFIGSVPRSLSIILRVLAFFVFGLYAMDFLVIKNFNTHLVVNDAMKYAPYTLKYLRQIYSGEDFLVPLLVIIVIGVVFSVVFSRYKIKNNKLHGLFIVSIAAISMASLLTSNELYVHSWIYKNVVDYNLTIMSESNEYSEKYIENLEINDKESCYTSVPGSPNIIILMVESLSAYQSSFFSGIKDWTPNLDEIARKNIAYTNFYANGFTTEDGEISLLTGLFPIYSPSSYTNRGGISFNGFYGIERSLPNILKQKGYTTEFLTTADLKFANTGNWAESIGFDYIEGSKHPYYRGWPRAHFNAAPDEALYNRVLSRIRNNRNNKYFIFIKTVSTHHPFKDPEKNNNSEAGAFQYADRQIGLFYRQLVETGFFDGGVLFIVGDHHAMIPLKEEEIAAYGSLKAAAVVPMIVSYGDMEHSVVSEQHQQTDIFHSLKGYVSDMQCFSDWSGNVFSQGEKTAKYIVHRRGDNRDIISIFSGDEEALIKLDGDNTRIISSKPPDKSVQELLVKKVNAVRISRLNKIRRRSTGITSTK